MTARTWQPILVTATKYLAQAGIDTASTDARWLLAHAIGVAPDTLTTVLREPAKPAAIARFDDFVQRRLRHEPVSHIIGQREFFGRVFKVTSDVLDPRPETEALVMAAMERPAKRILDVGTGSGCILLTLLAENPAATGIGSDISKAALKVANENSKNLNLLGRCAFCQSDWFANIIGQFDLIVSNPPYISQAEIAMLTADVLEYEPHLALTPGGDGLQAYRIIAENAPRFLTTDGRLIVEIGPTQATAVIGLFQTAGFVNMTTHADLDGRQRVIIADMPEQ